MRDYGKLFSGFWTSPDIQSMTDDGKILAAYVLTCHHANIIGCFRLPDGYVADDLGWCFERVSKGFDELFAKGFATRDNQSKWVVVHKYLKWNQPENPNQVKAAIKAFDTIPESSGVKPLLARSIAEFCDEFNYEILKPFLNPSETVAKPVTVTVTGVAIEKGKRVGQKHGMTLHEFLEQCKSNNEKAILEDDPIFEWAKTVSLPSDMLHLGWTEFKNIQAADKKQADWRATFRNYVKKDYLKVWALNREGEYYLTLRGKQLERELNGAPA